MPYMNPGPGVFGTDSWALHESLMRCWTIDFDATPVIACNTTPLVLVANANSLKALIFHGALVQLFGGTANYDQNQDFIVKYQTGGGGATVSTTLANFCNAGAAGKISTIKLLTTDIVPEFGQDLVLTSSASPKSAAGNRKLRVTVFASVFEKAV